MLVDDFPLAGFLPEAKGGSDQVLNELAGGQFSTATNNAVGKGYVRIHGKAELLDFEKGRDGKGRLPVRPTLPVSFASPVLQGSEYIEDDCSRIVAGKDVLISVLPGGGRPIVDHLVYRFFVCV